MLKSKMEDDEKEPNRIINFGFKGAGCFLLLIIILCLAFFSYVFVTKPKDLWSPVVSFLNNGVEIENDDKISFLEARGIVEDKINQDSSEVVIPEEVITALTQDSFETLRNLNVQIEDGEMHLYFEIERSVPENPLYGLVVVRINKDQNLEIERVGTAKIGTPKQFNKVLVNVVLSYLTLGEKLENENLIYKILASKNSFKAESIEFKKDNLILKNISFDLY